MSFRPAGMSDDEEDDEDEFGFVPRRRPAYTSRPTNGAPKTMEEAINRKDLESAQKFLDIALARGLSINARLQSGLPPLVMACNVGFVEGIEILIKNGADPNIESELVSPLSTCCTIGLLPDEVREACVDRLLRGGANPNKVDRRGFVPLMMAASNGFKKVVQRLIACEKTIVNETDPRGRTALFFAMEAGHLDIVQLLVDGGVEPGIKDKDGYTAEELFYVEESAESLSVADLFLDPSSAGDADLSVYKATDPGEQYLKEFLNELPGPDGEGGFSSMVRQILDGSGQPNLSLPNADLYSILSGCDEELQKIGVKLLPLRRNILRSVHRYHLRPWSQMSLFQPNREQNLGMEDVVNLVATTLRHLVIMRSCVGYLKGRISRSTEDHVAERREQVRLLADFHRSQRMIQKRLEELIIVIEKINFIGEYSPGYIPPQPTSKSILPFKPATALATILMAAFVYFHYTK